MLLSAQEARQISASHQGIDFDLENLNSQIRVAAQAGLYSVAVHLDPEVSKAAVEQLERRLRAAGFSTEPVPGPNFWSIIVGWR